jgi:isopentenyl diphosphate isomerase/L-lactate dehydrogenase-like FMN-dependent dehydrogenase
MVASTLATVSLEDVAAAAPTAARWFQIYVRTDRAWSAELIARAVDAGYRAADAVLAAVGALAHRHGGRVVLPYRTEVYVFARTEDA